MSVSEDFNKAAVSSGKMSRRKILKITSVVVVALMILVAYHGIQLDTKAPWPPIPPEPRANAGYESFYNYEGRGLVNTANGNLYLKQKDISLKAQGFNIEIIRSFNTQERLGAYAQDYFGCGWTCNYFIYLKLDRTTKNVTLTEGDGSVFVYGYIDGTNYFTPAGKHMRLNRDAVTGTFTLRFLDGSIYNFDSGGILQNITDKNNNRLKFTYTSGKLTKIAEDSGLVVGDPTIYLNISYFGDKVTTINDPFGRYINYYYTGNVLTKVTDPIGNYTLYSYDLGTAGPSTPLLDGYVDKVGSCLNFTYELDLISGKYRVKYIYSSNWNYSSGSSYATYQLYKFVYIEGVSCIDKLNDTYILTNVTDPNGNVFRIYHNDYGTPVKSEDPRGNYTMSKWDSDLNVIAFTDKNNSTYNYTYKSYYEGSGGNATFKTYGILNRSYDPTGNYTKNDYTFTDDTTHYVALLMNYTDKRGNKTTYGYDENYNLNSTTDARGNTSRRTYDPFGNMIGYVDSRGATTNYSYDAHGNLVNTTDCGGNVTEYGYDNKNRLKNITDARGYITTYEYDDLDRIVKITDALGNYTTYIYDNGSEGVYTTGVYGGCGGGYSIGGHTPVSIIDANGLQTNLTLNHSVKRIQKIEESAGCGCSEKNFVYDNYGNLIEFKDAKGNKTTYEYDSQNRLTKETDARGNYTTYTYDANGNLLTRTDRRGYTTTYEYNTLNRRTKETDPTGNSTEYTYDENGNIKTVTNAREYTTTYYYDELNRLTKVEDAQSHNTTYSYDENGNKKTETDPNGNTVTYTYDYQNRMISIVDALDHETSYEFDENGNKVTETDANGNTTTYAYDGLNRLSSLTDANGNVTSYTYDTVGRLLNVTDANGHKTRMLYNNLGRLSKVTYPSGNETEYDYDSLGNMIEREDAKGLSTYYTYDELNRLTQMEYPDNSMITNEYDAEGNPTKLTNNGGFGETTEYTYDEMNRVVSVKVDYGTFVKYVNYTYDEVGNRATMVDPEGNTTYYTYDAENRLVNITAPGQSPILLSYDNGGRRTRLDYPNGAYATYSYDSANRITTIWHKKSDGSTIAVYNYSYDNIGNILIFTENDVDITTYTYDNVYRLINVSYPDNSWTAYTYDGVGNRLNMRTATETTTYTYDEDNRILTAGSITYKHDENGNMVNRTDGSDITLYAYDYDNRLTQVTLSNSSTVEYQYSADGHRLNKTGFGSTTIYLYDGNIILMELGGNGLKKAYYNYEIYSKDDEKYYYHTDVVGTIRLLTDSNNNIVARYSYDAFGAIQDEEGTVYNSYRFIRGKWDDVIEMYDINTHFFDTNLGRFIQNIPLNSYTKQFTSNPYYFEITTSQASIKKGLSPIKNSWSSIGASYPKTTSCDNSQKSKIKDATDRIRNYMFSNFYTITWGDVIPDYLKEFLPDSYPIPINPMNIIIDYGYDNPCYKTVMSIGGRDLWNCLSEYIFFGEYLIQCADDIFDAGGLGCAIKDALGYTPNPNEDIIVLCAPLWGLEPDNVGHVGQIMMHELSHLCGLKDNQDINKNGISDPYEIGANCIE